MSNLDLKPTPTPCGGEADSGPIKQLLTGRAVQLGESTEVRRLLPNLGRRMVGAWCFVDHYGPDDITDEPGMQVPPHPHAGLQTVSWLHEGSILHRDSLGSLQPVRARELGLMTSGRGITHSEESPRPHARYLHGAQLWVALPDAHRHMAPAFEHHAELPRVTAAGLDATVILGALDGATSPGTTYSPLVGADLTLREGASQQVPLEEQFEYAVLSMSGSVDVDGVRVEPGSILYLGTGRRALPLLARTDASVLLLGGVPFEEHLVMWWNFIARTGEEIAQARTEWMAGAPVFGEVHGYDGARLAAPELPPVPLKPRGRVR
ncbi:pirin family protein [Kitasatospora sp. NPDC096147]|uniref:pirin family protein n=1 Tax=Kitasatospora sp. NPDC096147 TaxID=3364093 RepID=UPI003802E834